MCLLYMQSTFKITYMRIHSLGLTEPERPENVLWISAAMYISSAHHSHSKLP